MSDRLVRAIVRKFENTGIAEDDLCQEGMLALLKAERTFNSQRGVKFETYASMVIRNRLIDIIRAKKKHPEIVPNPGVPNPGDIVVGEPLEDEVDRKEKRKILALVLNSCHEIERAIFNAYYQGFSYEEIGGIFAVSRKKIDNTIQKIKKRVKLEYEN